MGKLTKKEDKADAYHDHLVEIKMMKISADREGILSLVPDGIQ